MAKGKYIAILDDDDFFIDSNKLSKQCNFLDKNPDFVLTSTNIKVIDAEKNITINVSDITGSDKELRNRILKENPFAHSSIMYRKEAALTVGGYDSLLERGKDYDLWLKLGKKGKFHIFKQPMTAYRISSRGLNKIFKLRWKDSKATAYLIWKYRNDYPGFFLPFMQMSLRTIVFYIFSKIFKA